MKEKNNDLLFNDVTRVSSKAQLLSQLREKQGGLISGSVLAKELGVSRVAIWKTVQSLVSAGYSIETKESGYLLKPENEKDFLYPWEFENIINDQNELQFYHYLKTDSTMNRARDLALRTMENASALQQKQRAVVCADKQSAGRGRYGRTWISRQGGLFFSILEKPKLTISDYTLLSLVIQIAIVKSISAICGKKAFLRWPNDIYINNRKIAGLTTEVLGDGDLISWFIGGIGININNKAPTLKAISCSEILGKQISRKDVLCKILQEIENINKKYKSNAAYFQGNSNLAKEWNSLSDCIGAKTAVFEPESKDDDFLEKQGKILARGIFKGIDPIGRCIIKTEDANSVCAEELYFNHGSVSLAFLN
ncbi:MAG: biotin--[acetyl-CoA-carboxylase] ligase [Treponema sp.]|nr:biotin--[acetyl-CoA-carboxylase] ligase [Treponema sp.]MCL2251523.1 biotin--[acetyl-CoA-carboxylase] ligase [Treponema sp.]